MTHSKGLNDGSSQLREGLVSVDNHHLFPLFVWLQISKPRPFGPVWEESRDCHVILLWATHMIGEGDSEVGVGVFVAVGDSGRPSTRRR